VYRCAIIEIYKRPRNAIPYCHAVDAAAPEQTRTADVCLYRIHDETDHYGTYTVVSAIVCDYGLFSGRTRGVFDYAARQAVASIDCERRW
jgi:hypothetical protein